jgi:preprotein translocase subunit Sec61beta
MLLFEAHNLSKKGSDEGAPMPAASAGLLRFFEEETEGIKLRPEIVVVMTIALILIALLAQLSALGKLPI